METPESTLYFTYGTLQTGYPNHASHAEDLGPSLGRYRTVEAWPLVVPLAPSCPNPGCRFDHRIGALLERAGQGECVEGELFEVSGETLERFDELENYRPQDEAHSTYLRRSVRVEPVSGGEGREAQVYFIVDAAPYEQLLQRHGAEVVGRYTLEMAQGRLKACCRRDPDHEGPHEARSPFGP